ncbi:hypothetical protein DPMN_137015 [Dreissena polymorpha]|uniref:G-protein coupled receptors family 1 profile domain-containing protein n=1 Tax=Dreissena polymorpha TaxID=45954 RepID=A0A9D4G143_DREPO|nr:hypothetical protein DPMN_137015 [Dreissena polymorpha]
MGFGTFYGDIWSIVVLVVLNVVPMLIIILGNINIRINIVRQKRRLRTQQSNRNNDTVEISQTRRHKDASRNSVTRMLLLISIFLILTTFPFTIYRCLWFEIDDSSLKAHAKRHLYDSILEVILYCNFTFNFFFYFVSGSLFEEDWHRMVDEMRSRLACFCSFRSLTENERQQENPYSFQGLENTGHPV